MKKSLIFLLPLTAAAAMIVSCTGRVERLSSSDYCIMFYSSGGDSSHTECIMDYRDAMEMVLPESQVAVTWLIKSHDSTVTTLRSYTQNAEFVTDTAWDGGTGYDIVSHENLSEFIKWSATMFPGRKYVLVTAGHGDAWRPAGDGAKASGLLYDGVTRKSMTPSDLARGIGESGVDVEVLIANNCLQGSVETLADWDGYVDYVVFGGSYLPDIGGDYPYFIKLLDRSEDMRSLLYEYVEHCGEFFNGIEFPFEHMGSSFSAVDMSRFAPLMESLRGIFDEMGGSLDRLCATTDSPQVLGRSYADGYRAAMDASLQMDLYRRKPGTCDLYDFLYRAVVYTAHPELMTLVGEFRNQLEEAVILNVHNYKLDGFKVSFNICTLPEYFEGERLESYRTSKFDQATGWSGLMTELF